jgi:hypothetical protein
VVCDYNAFVLRDPLTLSSAVVVKLMGDLDASEEEIQGKFRPLASDRPVIVSDAVLGKEWQVEVLVKDTTVEAALNVLRRLQTPLIFQTDMTDRWYWVRIGPSVSEKTYRQIDRVTASKRTQSWSFSLIEVQPVPGQPQVYI